MSINFPAVGCILNFVLAGEWGCSIPYSGVMLFFISFPAVECFLNFVLAGGWGCSIPYSGIYAFTHNGVSTFCLHDSSFREVVTFSTITIQKACTCVQTFLFMLYCELLWDPLYKDFMEGEPVMDNFISWTMTNLQFMCHFICSHLSSAGSFHWLV